MKPIRTLLVEDRGHDGPDLEETLSSLAEGGLELERAGDLSSALERLSRRGLDLVFLDLSLPDSRGIPTLERIHAFAPDVPIVVVVDAYDEEAALAALQAGAQDFLVKDVLGSDLVLRVARYAMERHRLLSALESLSLIDHLTGLYNARGFRDLGARHLQLARRAGRPLLLVHVDIVSLRSINDSQGHHAGDQALQAVADLLRSTFRQSDILARVGGDEFAVLALEAGRESQGDLVERLMGKARAMSHRNWEPSHLDLSVATAWFDGREGVHLDDLLAVARERLARERRPRA